MQINNELGWSWIDFILNSISFSLICYGLLIFLPYSLYGIFIHIKKYGINEKIKGNHIFKGEKPVPMLIFEIIIFLGGIYIMFIKGKAFIYINQVNIFLNNL